MEMKMMMLEQAEEELQILEAQYPNRFNYLKLELKSFIYLIKSQNIQSSNMEMVSSLNSPSAPACSSATTQASSSCKKRKKKKGDKEMGIKPKKHRTQTSVAGRDIDSQNLKMDRVEFVIEKAQTCLRKIQQFKTSF